MYTCFRPFASSACLGSVSLVVAGALVLQSSPAAQNALPERESVTVLIGRVYAPDGTPAAGAVVVSSAGGRAVSDARGAYRLEVDVPIDAELVELTAFAGSTGRSLVGSTLAAASGARGTAPDTIVLASVSCCQPSWVPRFGGLPGLAGGVDALAVFDDGGGPALYVAGGITCAGGVPANNIAKWDGTSWSALGAGLNSPVYALAVFDDGNGPALYAGGVFTNAGGVPAIHVAKWDGSQWSALGDGLGGATNSAINALAVFDDGSGLALYAAGDYLSPAYNRFAVAKWNGSTWVRSHSWIDTGTARALTVFDDGSGSALYVGGTFGSVHGVAGTNGIAKWDGSTWSAVGNGVDGWVNALVPFDDGSGPVLVAGGFFTSAGGVAASRIARWDGASWSALGSGMNREVRALAVFDDGGGPALYAGSESVSKWDGTSWSSVGFGQGNLVSALMVYDDGSGPALHAGVNIRSPTSQDNPYVARWDGSSWSPLVPLADSGLNDQVRALAMFDDGSGPALYAGGSFTSAGGIAASRIAKWNGSSWSALAGGVTGLSQFVNALTVFDDGNGPALYAGGEFGNAGGVSASRIAQWNGSSWSAVGTGMNCSVFALTVFDDGSGPALYAGGCFTSAGSVTANRIARWNGTSWSTVGSGVGSGQLGIHSVTALTTFDDGSGPALYAAGWFDIAGGVPAPNIASWNGASWSAVGGGLNSRVGALTVFDDGSGPALYAGGYFQTVGGSGHVAKWNGTTWSNLGSGVNNGVNALAVFDDGGGEALYAGGEFTAAGLVAANRIARWKGGSWSALGSGMNNSVSGPVASSVFALAVLGDGVGASLFAGGSFESAIDSHDSYLAEWGCFDVTPPMLISPRGVIALDDLSPGEVVDFTVTATDSCDAEPSVVCMPPSGSFFPRGTTMVTCTATDAAGNQSTCSFPVSVALSPRRR